MILWVTAWSWRGLGNLPTHCQQCSSVGLSCPTTAGTDLWRTLCPQRPHQHQGPTAGTSCNSHHRESYFIRVSNDPCSHIHLLPHQGGKRLAKDMRKGCRARLQLQVGTPSLGLKALHSPGFWARLAPHSYAPFPLPAEVSTNTKLHRLCTHFLCWLCGQVASAYSEHLGSNLRCRHGRLEGRHQRLSC